MFFVCAEENIVEMTHVEKELMKSFCFFFSVCVSVLSSILKRGTEGFWKSVARRVPRDASEIRILNPYFIQEAAFQFIGLPFNNGLMGKGVSTH